VRKAVVIRIGRRNLQRAIIKEIHLILVKQGLFWGRLEGESDGGMIMIKVFSVHV
jgi:hypothetical protein